LVTKDVSRLEKLRTPPTWVRGLYVAVLSLAVVGNLAVITLSWAPQGGPRIYAALVFLWILALVALLFLLRLWRATVWPRRQS
jgi:hypothetical protein